MKQGADVRSQVCPSCGGPGCPARPPWNVPEGTSERSSRCIRPWLRAWSCRAAGTPAVATRPCPPALAHSNHPPPQQAGSGSGRPQSPPRALQEDWGQLTHEHRSSHEQSCSPGHQERPCFSKTVRSEASQEVSEAWGRWGSGRDPAHPGTRRSRGPGSR